MKFDNFKGLVYCSILSLLVVGDSAFGAFRDIRENYAANQQAIPGWKAMQAKVDLLKGDSQTGGPALADILDKRNHSDLNAAYKDVLGEKAKREIVNCNGVYGHVFGTVINGGNGIPDDYLDGRVNINGNDFGANLKLAIALNSVAEHALDNLMNNLDSQNIQGVALSQGADVDSIDDWLKAAGVESVFEFKAIQMGRVLRLLKAVAGTLNQGNHDRILPLLKEMGVWFALQSNGFLN